MATIDLRSDLLTRPTDAMLQAMMEAGKRERGYGYREDADVRELERLAADLLGKEDALLFPTCSMANQVALMAFCRPGQSVLVDAAAHLCGPEAASTSALAGAVTRYFPTSRGHPSPEAVKRSLGEGSAALLWLENTHNRAGGTVLTPEHQRRIVAVSHANGVPVHLDGARIWNAAVALERPPADLARDVDTVSVSLNKCLGVPLGALLAGDQSFIAEAERLRHLLGGAWRPAGIIAAAAVAALTPLPSGSIAQDHSVALEMAEKLAQYRWLDIDLDCVQTNIVVAKLREGYGFGNDLMKALQGQGVLTTPLGSDAVRLVTYAQIRKNEADVVLSIFADLDRSVYKDAANFQQAVPDMARPG